MYWCNMIYMEMLLFVANMYRCKYLLTCHCCLLLNFENKSCFLFVLELFVWGQSFVQIRSTISLTFCNLKCHVSRESKFLSIRIASRSTSVLGSFKKCKHISVCELLCVCVCVLAKVVNRGHPWVLLQATGHTFHTGHMPVCSKWLKQCKMSYLKTLGVP